MMNEKDLSRFWEKVDKSGECWLWIGAKYGNGYGHFVLERRHYLAHRLAWMIENGEIPKGLVIMHMCDTKDCVRIDHLRLGTYLDNTRDMIEKGRARYLSGEENPQYGKRQSHCKNGHEMTEENTVWTDGGKARRCRICYQENNRIRALQWLHNHKEEVNQKRRERREPLKVGVAKGERHGLTTLTTQQVIEIRIQAKEGSTFASLANLYHVNAATIANIVYRRTWKHVK